MRNRHATTHYLNRILIYLDEIGTPVNKTKIRDDCCMMIESVNEALLFLVHHRLVAKHRWGNIWMYKFNRVGKAYKFNRKKNG